MGIPCFCSPVWEQVCKSLSVHGCGSAGIHTEERVSFTFSCSGFGVWEEVLWGRVGSMCKPRILGSAMPWGWEQKQSVPVNNCSLQQSVFDSVRANRPWSTKGVPMRSAAASVWETRMCLVPLFQCLEYEPHYIVHRERYTSLFAKEFFHWPQCSVWWQDHREWGLLLSGLSCCWSIRGWETLASLAHCCVAGMTMPCKRSSLKGFQKSELLCNSLGAC